MEIDENQLQFLSTKAWSIVDNLSHEIESQSISVCKHCSEHGVLCEIAESTWWEEEKQRLIAIQDSVKDVDRMLVSLQRLHSDQHQHFQEAVSKLENSRLQLMENIKKFRKHEWGQMEVIDELKSCFAEKMNMEKQIEELKVEHDKSRVLTNRFKGLFDPLNWLKIAIKLALFSVLASSAQKFCQSGQNYKCVWSTDASKDSSIARTHRRLAFDSDEPLDVSFASCWRQ